MASIPTLETERLVLREWRDDDFEPFARMSADAEVMRFIGGAQARADAWRAMATFIGHWTLRGYGFWVVERKADRMFVGRIGLWQPEGWPGLEVGWALDRPYWGNGYATEAAAASLDYGFRNYPERRLISLIDPANGPSQAVARRLGHSRGAPAEIRIGGRSFFPEVWEMTRDAWPAAREKLRR